MKRLIKSTFMQASVVALLAFSVSGCNTTTRLSEIGDGPQLTSIKNPTSEPDYRPVSLPMPAPIGVEINPNSLWRSGAKAFFKDQRAKEVGDIMTVSLNLSDRAVLNNKSERDRDDSEVANVTNLLGLEAELGKVLPEAIAPATVAGFGNTHSTSGDGKINRDETIVLTLAAVVIQVLPNGNLVIAGRQEIRVSNELRELRVTGIIRQSDIDTTNTVSHTKIAEMRVAYGGRGTLSDLQQPRWGTQIWDIVFPF
jgi:flagellar L-ring protein precursor FlgH